MSFSSGPWDGQPFAEADWRTLIGRDGGRLLEVGTLSRSASTRTVTLSGIVAAFEGALVRQSGSDSVTIPTPSDNNRRIDWLVLEYDPSGNAVTLERIGTSGANPSEPSLDFDIHLPLARFGPFGTGPVMSAPFLDARVMQGRMLSAPSVEAAAVHARERGDVVHTPDGIYWHDGNQLVSYFAARSEVFSTSDSGYPRRLEGFSGQISNSLTVPSRDFDRALAITANHWLRTPSGVEYDSWLRLDGNHEREFRHTVTGSASLSTVVRLPARRSLRILTGFTRASSSGGAAISSATRAANNINVHATPA